MYTITWQDGKKNESYKVDGFDKAISEAMRAASYMDKSNDYEGVVVSVTRDSDGFTVWSSDDNERLKFYESHSMDEWKELENMPPLFAKMVQSQAYSVYFDIDGTLGYWYDNAKGLKYPEEVLDPNNHYFRNIEPHMATVEIARKLVEKGVDVCILSSADRDTLRDKMEWIEEHCPFIKEENIFFCPIGADKARFVKGNVEYSVLIDDYHKNLDAWKNHGGYVIKLINSVNSHDYRYDSIKAFEYEQMLKNGDIDSFDDYTESQASYIQNLETIIIATKSGHDAKKEDYDLEFIDV